MDGCKFGMGRARREEESVRKFIGAFLFCLQKEPEGEKKQVKDG